MRVALAVCVSIIVLSACTTPTTQPVPITPAAEVPGAAVARRPVESVPPVAALSPSASAPPAPLIVVPADTLYVCVADTGGQRTQTSIAFDQKVGDLCRRHPEMGPCQYVRDQCRRSGGRVYAANGTEITRQTEDEYDKKVLRVRFKAN
jgi:hypothetical protein